MINLAEEMRGVKSVAISGHIRPDGDCVGACLAVYNYIREQYPDVEAQVYLDPIPQVFSFLKGADEICLVRDREKKYDLFMGLDSGDKERLGESLCYFETAGRTLCIDHHISNQGYAGKNYIVPEASSTSELVFGILEEEKISREVAEALYVGIVHDTGVFQYSCTSPATMETAGKLMGKGIDFTRIIDDTFYKKTYIQNQILGRALLESILLLDGKCIVSRVLKRDMEFYGVEPKDLDGIVSQLRVTAGVEVAIFLYETDNQEYKASLRANGPVDVSRIAGYFGGGGHKKAAGLTMRGTYYDVLNNLSEQIELQMENTAEG